MKSDVDSQTLLDQCYKRIVLQVPMGEHVPCLKNSKRAIKDKRTGHLRTLTEPKVKRWMRECIQSFVSQLISGEATRDGAMLMEPCPPSLIALSLPEDDSMNWVPEIRVYVTDCEKGNEGAEIIIERIQ